MSRRKNRKPRFTLSQGEADRLIAQVKHAVDDFYRMPAEGEKNAEFHVRSDTDDEDFTIAMYCGSINQHRHTMSARITKLGVPLLRLCVNGQPHRNPDGRRVGRTHWHVYTEGLDDLVAFPADLGSDGFIDDTIELLDRFHVIRKPSFQGSML
ncbi:DUF6978 family protein [Bifidobacterium thermacidophilum]|uniref:Prophage protein n=1 Tax=Bifidobacterium thermacidophilum subsp. thermacidophilum TaxID=79262 RepID=A0A087E4H1_9BIFI|nr:hypothetical protein [Bifidobacterium thermacidophilum]KFJ02672.1 prophage protein [Bifidobacterium thermacidophilum subsp. thermacidophilum]